MATLGIAATHANILTSGLASWKVKWGMNETPDDAYYSLGALADGSVVIRSLSTPGEYGQNAPYVVQLEASAKMLCTNKTTVLELMGNLLTAQLAHKITAINGKTFSGEFGTKIRFDSSADFNGHRYVEIMANHHVLLDHSTVDDLATILAAPAADGTADAGDTLYAWSATTKYPAGVTGLTVNPAGDQETIGKYRNARFIIESLGTTDHFGRYIGSNMRITLEADMLQTNTEPPFLGANFPAITSAVIALSDNAAIFLTNNFDCNWEYNLAGGAETMSFAKLTMTKVIKASDWAGMLT